MWAVTPQHVHHTRIMQTARALTYCEDNSRGRSDDRRLRVPRHLA
jgi:hypothetical protein